VFTRHINKAVV